MTTAWQCQTCHFFVICSNLVNPIQAVFKVPCWAVDFLPKVSSNCVSSNCNLSSSPPLYLTYCWNFVISRQNMWWAKNYLLKVFLSNWYLTQKALRAILSKKLNKLLQTVCFLFHLLLFKTLFCIYYWHSVYKRYKKLIILRLISLTELTF